MVVVVVVLVSVCGCAVNRGCDGGCAGVVGAGGCGCGGACDGV